MKGIFFCFLYVIGFLCMGQTSGQVDTLKSAGKKNHSTADSIKKDFKNTIRYNITNPVLFGEGAIIFGYERTLNNRQSISINIGRAVLPGLSILNIDTITPDITLNKSSTEKGFNGSVDYRFYLTKLNAYDAPRGVYIGPFYSFNFFERENTWTLNTESFQGDVVTDFKINMHTIGFELGYQFVFWKRLALDLILIGPGVARYAIKTDLSTTLEPDDEAELFQKINDALADKIPGYSFVIDDQEYKRTGRVNTTSLGFRYMIHLGFRF
jgi:hypothetical protein